MNPILEIIATVGGLAGFPIAAHQWYQRRRMKPLLGSIDDFRSAVTTTLKHARTTYHQLTISPALFHGLDRDDHFEDYRILMHHQLVRRRSAELYHLEHNALQGVFGIWGGDDSAKVDRIKSRYQLMVNSIKEWQTLNLPIATHEVVQLRERKDHPVPFLLAVADLEGERAIAVMSLFRFRETLEKSEFPGFLTTDNRIAKHLGEVMHKYNDVMKV